MPKNDTTDFDEQSDVIDQKWPKMTKNDWNQPKMTKNNKKMTQNNSRRPKMTKNDTKKQSVTDGPTDGGGCRVACTRLKIVLRSCLRIYILHLSVFSALPIFKSTWDLHFQHLSYSPNLIFDIKYWNMYMCDQYTFSFESPLENSHFLINDRLIPSGTPPRKEG